MKTLKLKIILLCCLFSMASFGQNCKNFKKGVRKAKKHFSDKEIISATKPRRLFSKFSQAVSTHLVKSENTKYLAIIFVREFGRRIDLLGKNPITLQFENSKLITLYPEKPSFGKFTLPATTELNRQFYTITNEQLQLLSSNSIVHIKIYFTSDLVSESKYEVDDLGKFFDYEILSERYQSNLINAANCMLQLKSSE